MLQSNTVMAVDSYKVCHWCVYPTGTTKIKSYFESRAPAPFADETIFFGLQYYLITYLVGQRVYPSDLPRMRQLTKAHFGNEDYFNEEGWRYILDKHDGFLPIRIKCVPEGTVVPYGNVLMTVENTDPACAWLTNYIETLLVKVWYPITVASLSYSIRQTIQKYLYETCESQELADALLPSRLHDFGYRGVSSEESAAIGGAAHLTSFQGTDTLAAIVMIAQNYSNEHWQHFCEKEMPGFSIPATEHSIMTLEGPDGEESACRRLLHEFPEGFIACVSDSYDLFSLCENTWGESLRESIMNRDGCLVIRPDSGNPEEIIPDLLDLLSKKFGCTTNSKGYKVLHDSVRIIQGDGIDYITVADILEAMKQRGWSAENIAFGSGGALLQKMNRDTFAFAFKACLAEINGETRRVFKDPVTGSSKTSKAGDLDLIRDSEGNFQTIDRLSYQGNESSELITVFENGKIVNSQSFQDIRNRINSHE